MVQKYFLGAICLIAFYTANADDGHKYGCVVQGLPDEYVCQEVKDIYRSEDTKNLNEKYKGRNVLIYKGKYYNLHILSITRERFYESTELIN